MDFVSLPAVVMRKYSGCIRASPEPTLSHSNALLELLRLFSPTMASAGTTQELFLLLRLMLTFLQSGNKCRFPDSYCDFSQLSRKRSHALVYPSLILIYSYVSLPLSIRLKVLYPGQVLTPFLVSLNNTQYGYNAMTS